VRQFSYLVLAGYEILRLGRVGWVDVPHPIGLGDVTTVYVIVQFVVLVNLDTRKNNIFIPPVYLVSKIKLKNSSAYKNDIENIKKCTHPPEVFSVGRLGDLIFGINFTHQWPETRATRNVTSAPDALHLKQSCPAVSK
jgi:hypothetical protein